MARTILIYGESGTFKSSNLGEIAEYLLSRFGGITRLLTADSGVAPMQEQIDRGVIQYWDITTAKSPMGLFRKALRGYWPDKLVNGKADENSFRPTTAEEWRGISGVFVEGITRVADVMMQDLREKGRDTGEPLQAKFQDSGVNFAQASRGTYGFVQTYSQDWIGELKTLPVPWVVVTAHEGKGEDLVSKKTVFGPAIVGKAGTDKVCGWFENSIHTESYKIQVKGEVKPREGVRGCFVRHSDAEVGNVYWPAKLGLPPKAMAGVIKKFPNGYVAFRMNSEGVYTSGMHTLMEAIDTEMGVALGGLGEALEVEIESEVEVEVEVEVARASAEPVNEPAEEVKDIKSMLAARVPTVAEVKASRPAVKKAVQGVRIPVGAKK